VGAAGLLARHRVDRRRSDSGIVINGYRAGHEPAHSAMHISLAADADDRGRHHGLLQPPETSGSW